MPSPTINYTFTWDDFAELERRIAETQRNPVILPESVTITQPQRAFIDALDSNDNSNNNSFDSMIRNIANNSEDTEIWNDETFFDEFEKIIKLNEETDKYANFSAKDISYGVELETICNRGAFPDGWKEYWRKFDNGFDDWIVTYDSSIHDFNDEEEKDYEFNSPVLKRSKGFREIENCIEEIKKADGRVNTSCGVHIHVGWPFVSLKTLKYFVYLVSHYENALFAIGGSPYRKFESDYCHTIKNTIKDNEKNYLLGRTEKYKTLNLNKLLNPNECRTVEFRLFPGSINIENIRGWVHACLALVEYAVVNSEKEIPNFDYIPLDNSKRNCYNVTEARRFMKNMGWFDDSKRPYGFFNNNKKYIQRIRTKMLKNAINFDRKSIKQNYSLLGK